MSSLWKAGITSNLTTIIQRPSPTKYSNIPHMKRSLARDFHSLIGKQSKWHSIERISLGTFREQTESCHSASMTVEAALVLPLLLFFFLNLTSAFEMIRLHNNLELALWNIGTRMSVYGYAYENLAKGLIEENPAMPEAVKSLADVAFTNLYARNKVIEYLGRDYLDQAPLINGAKGLNFLESVFVADEDCVRLVVTYRVSPWMNVLGVPPLRMANQYYGHAWTGYRIPVENDETEMDYVYVTEHGQVYHETKECSHIKLSVYQVSLEEVIRLRNEAGKRYSLCFLCRDKAPFMKVYITREGSRYHNSTECSGLKRSIIAIERKNAGKYRPCSRCAS